MASPATAGLLGCVFAVLGSSAGFNPASFHRTAFDKRWDEGLVSPEDLAQDAYPVQMPQCLAVGGVCTSAQHCLPGRLLNLQVLAADPCGDQAGVVCCRPTLLNHEEVLQVDACNQKGAVCTRSSSCPKQAQLDNPLLCGDQSDVTCCRTQPEKKNSVDFKSESKNELHVKNRKRFLGVDAVIIPPERRALGVAKRKDISKALKSTPFKLTTLGVAKRNAPTCAEAQGVCVRMERCPEGDIVADQKFCSGDESIVCCRLSPATIGEDTFRYVSYPDGGTDPEDLNPI